MAGRVIYLDVDDEITSAAARIRAAEGGRVAVVLPYGSRVATSRINFRLLARDALVNGKRLSVVAGDAATRALAASAGMPTFATIAEYESSLDPDDVAEPGDAGPGGVDGDSPAAADDDDAGAGADDDADADAPRVPDPPAALPAATPGSARGRRPREGRTDAPAGDDRSPAELLASSAATVTPATPAAPAAASSPDGPAPDRRPAEPPDRPPVATARTGPRHPAAVPAERVMADSPSRDRPNRPAAEPDRRRTNIGIAAAVLALAVVIGGVAAFLLLPSARATITPRQTTVGPISMRIVASTAATEPDVAAKVVPALTKTIDVETSQRFPVTGKRIEEAPATGSVRFRNKDFTSSEAIPKGSIVSTQGGIRFRTDAAITVPRAELVGLQIFPATASVKVTAVDPGPEGNVEPNTILVIPRGEDPLTLDVTNPDATTGGTREEFPLITQEDVDGAVATLGAELQAAFEQRLADPELTSDGTTVFPETAQLGAPDYSTDLTELVGQEVDGFDLGISASGTVLAVDEAPVRLVAEANIDPGVDPGYELIEGSTSVDVAPALVEGGVVTFPVVVTARQVLVIDTAAIESEILGRSLADARVILDRYGTVDLAVWPEWVATIPTLDARVDVVIATSITVDRSSPSPGASP